MGRLAVLVERATINRSEELEALLRFRMAAEALGHDIHFLFRPELRRIPRYDALFIRALTDPMNATYVAARIAEMHGKPTLDDSRSIAICCDKVHMYRRLMRHGVPVPRTAILTADQIEPAIAEQLFADIGRQIVLKAPNTSFSSHVERVTTADEFVRIGRRFLHRAERIVAQEFIASTFDWRVGILAGEPLFCCRYMIPDETFKIQATVNGHMVMAKVEPVPLAETPPAIVATAIAAARAVGGGLYGVDLKQSNGDVVVIEVNDNPTINAEEEDRYAPDVYARIVTHLMRRPTVPVTRPTHAQSDGFTKAPHVL
ncbi:MAG: ATP-grasp domain-containing protein [Candidatus Zixiibacteriota bacterium]